MTRPEFVKLRNGARIGEPILATSHLTLADLFKSGIPGVLAVHELNKAARTEGGKITNREALTRLVNLGLAHEDGSIHDDIRQVVINSLEGDGLKMRLVNPLPTKG